MARTLLAVLLLGAGPLAIARVDESPTIAGTVRAGGAPVAGASVWLYTYTGQSPVESDAATTDAQGHFTLPVTEPVKTGRSFLFARDTAGGVGMQDLYRVENFGPEPTLRVELHQVGEARGRVLDGSGRPIAGARVRATDLSDPADDPQSARQYHLPPSLARRYETVTAADGSFALPGVPTGSKLITNVSAPGHGSINAYWSQARPCELRLEPAGCARVHFRGADEPRKLAGLVIDLHLRDQTGEVVLFVARDATAGPSDTLDVNDLPPGRYTLTVRP
jgi:hypothetical protein